MPFENSSTPEVFQHRMQKLIEGLCGVEVVVSDFVVIGFGDTFEEVVQDHDRNLTGLLQRCEQQQVRINTDKIKFRMHKVLFIGQIATQDNLSVDPQTVQAVLEMPPLKDVSALQCLLGLTQYTYLSKFQPHLKDITKPLRRLTQKGTA